MIQFFYLCFLRFAWPGMGVDLHSVLVDLNNQPEVWHQTWLTLLFIQGGALTLRVTAAAIVTFKHNKKGTYKHYQLHYLHHWCHQNHGNRHLMTQHQWSAVPNFHLNHLHQCEWKCFRQFVNVLLSREISAVSHGPLLGLHSLTVHYTNQMQLKLHHIFSVLCEKCSL